MDIITQISPYEYIGNSLGKINQNFLNLQKLPVALSAKYIQIDNFITSLRSQIVTDTVQVSGDCSVKETFRAEGDVIIGSNTRDSEKVVIKSWPVYLPHAITPDRSLIFGNAAFSTNTTDSNLAANLLTNLYRTNSIPGRPDTLQTDGDFRVVNNLTVGGNMWLSGSTWIGDAVADIVQIKSGNILLDNITSTSQAVTFGTTNAPKLYRSNDNLLRVESSLEVTQNGYLSGGLQTVNDINTTRNLNVSGTGKFTGVIHANLSNTGDTNDVVVERATSFELATRSIDSRVWGTSLLDGSSLTTDRVTKVSDSNTLVNSNITDNGTTITLDGRLTLKSGVVAGTATLVNGTTTVSTAAAAAGSIVLVTLRTRSGTTTNTWQYVASPGSGNFTITAITNTGTTNTLDTSTLSWMLVNVA